MINDNAGNPISTYIGSIAASEVQLCTVQVDTQEGVKLSSSVTGEFVVEARKVGDTPWVNIETTPIDLTPYAPARTSFQIRITAGSGIEGRNQFSIRVGV